MPTTSWTLVLSAAAETRRSLLEQLCAVYWPPVFAFIWARTRDREQAGDLTQAFFMRLLEKHELRSVQPQRGSFRSFLFAAVSHFLSNEWDRVRAEKRGGGRRLIPLDSDEARAIPAPELADGRTPEKIFERRWALALLDRGLARLRGRYEAAGHGQHFELLRGYLTGGGEETYRRAGESLGMSEAAVKMAVHRLRQRYGEALREEIAMTVADPGEVDAEVHYLLTVLAG